MPIIRVMSSVGSEIESTARQLVAYLVKNGYLCWGDELNKFDSPMLYGGFSELSRLT